jgi:hypothetical protein
VHVRGRATGDGLLISWIRRTRLGGDSWEAVEVPLGEDSEAYEVDILDGDAVKRTLAASQPQALYSQDDQIADWGAIQPAYDVAVYQLSAVYGRGQPRQARLPI